MIINRSITVWNLRKAGGSLLVAHWSLAVAYCLLLVQWSWADNHNTNSFYRRYGNNNLFSACSFLLWNWFIFGFSISVILHTCLKLVTMEEFLQKTFQSGEVPASVRQLFTGMSSTHLKYITFTGTAVVVFRYHISLALNDYQWWY